MANYSQHIQSKKNLQSEKALPEQKENSAGGYTFVVNEWDKLDRFLILGTEGGTYYATEKKLTIDNAYSIQSLIDKNGIRVVNRVVEISDKGRAPKNDQAIFVLAMCAASKDLATRKAAYDALPKVCRIGTHLFHFTRDVTNLRGWSRGLRRAVSKWYTDRSEHSLANQVIKYQQRDGWSNSDMFRLAHPGQFTKLSSGQEAIIQWVLARARTDQSKATKLREKIKQDDLSPYIKAFEEVQAEKNVKRVIKLIQEHNLPREAIPTEYLNDANVWEALLDGMGTTALIRNLAKMTSVGLIGPLSNASKKAAAQIANAEILKKDRIHPMSILIAMKQYSSGHGLKGSLSWNPERSIVDALDDAFYLSFDAVEPTGKDLVIALDVSGSMGASISGGANLSCREASAAMAMVAARTEKNYTIVGFTAGNHPSKHRGYNTGISVLNISPKQRLDDVVRAISGLSFGGTDCSLPMIWAKEKKIGADGFFTYTDNETWAGSIHPHQALREYRNAMGRPAKSVVIGMSATDFTIADPNDAGMMDIVGFDAAAPVIMADFIRGKVEG
jgi:60 kDa SS-A/Ro ribonucleoprotein